MTATPPGNDRFVHPIRAIVREEVAALKYLGTWEYSIAGVNEGDTITVNVTSTDPTSPFPSINNVAIRSGPEGGTSSPTPGNLCYVRFINGDPARPVVVGNEAIVNIATLDATDTVNVGPSVSNAVVLGGGNAPVARFADAVTVYLPKTPLTCKGTVFGGTPVGSFEGTISLTKSATGIINAGNPKVLA